MFRAYKKTSIKFFRWINSPLKLLALMVFLVSCQTLSTTSTEARLTEREVTFQKGMALFDNLKYAEASSFFLKISQNPVGPQDDVYDQSLWKLTLIYEKFGEYEKAVLALLELESRKPVHVSMLSIRFALIKNYIRLGNKKRAAEIQNKMASSFSLAEINAALIDNTHFKYDLTMIEELQFLGEIQKYFILVMESSDVSINQQTTSNLIGLYDGFFKALRDDKLNGEFKRNLAIELLEQLRKFDLYKLNKVNLNPETIMKFSNYSTEKQKLIIDWLHQ